MNIKVSRVLHAGYIFETPVGKVLMDPIFEDPFSYNCEPFPKIRFDLEQIKKQKWEAVLISHIHDDHFSLVSLDLIDRNTAIYLHCEDLEAVDFLNKMGFQNVHLIKPFQKLNLAGLEIQTWPALNEVDIVIQLTYQNIQILNVVDSWLHPETLADLIKIHWNLILWPFQLMREIEILTPHRFLGQTDEYPVEPQNQLSQFQTQAVVPSSCQFIFKEFGVEKNWQNQFYFGFSYQKFSNLMQQLNPAAAIYRLDPGQSVLVNSQDIKKADSISWIRPMDNKTVDYEFNPDIIIPQMNGYIGHLLSVEIDQIKNFCENGLIQYFDENGLELFHYFPKGFIWNLQVVGDWQQSYYFQFVADRKNQHGFQVQLVRPVTDSKVQWLTEISAYKLHSALNRSESLSSLEIRINDRNWLWSEGDEFSDLNSPDVVEDPLLGILYSSGELSYQRAQLKFLGY